MKPIIQLRIILLIGAIGLFMTAMNVYSNDMPYLKETNKNYISLQDDLMDLYILFLILIQMGCNLLIVLWVTFFIPQNKN